MMFKDREEAGVLLLNRLKKSRYKNAVVAGIPRGAVPMARTIADGLKAQLSLVLVHKIPSPQNEEFAVGCVGLSGHVHRSSYVDEHGISSTYLSDASHEQINILKDRQKKYGLTDPDWKGKTVIIVDDGVATGATAICAVHEARSLGAERVVFATPISSDEAAEELSHFTDEFISLYVSSTMFSIGEFYEFFPQVSDEEVLAALHDKGHDKHLTFVY